MPAGLNLYTYILLFIISIYYIFRFSEDFLLHVRVLLQLRPEVRSVYETIVRVDRFNKNKFFFLFFAGVSVAIHANEATHT